jgi:hypothetical protein
MLSYRILVQYDNRTAKVIPSTGSGIGAMTVRSPRGTLAPTYFKAGQTKRLFELCGDPGPAYPDLLEAAYFLENYPLWVSAPSKFGRYGGVILGNAATVKLPGGVAAIPTSGTTFTVYETIGVGDGVTTSFGKTLSSGTRYVANSAAIVSNGVPLAAPTNTGTTTETITGTGLTSCSLIVATGVMAMVFAAAPLAGAVIETSYTISVAADTAVLFSRAPQSDYLAVLVTQDTVTKKLTVVLSGNDGSGTYLTKKTFTFSMVPGSKDNYGNPDRLDQVITSDDDYLVPFLVKTVNPTAYTADVTNFNLNGGSRGLATIGSDLASAVAQFAQARKYPADVFFDNSAAVEVGTAFATLRGSGQQYSKYLLPNLNVPSATVLLTPTPVSDRGVKYFWNWGKVINPYNAYGPAWTSLIGEIAKNELDNVVTAFGGRAVSWINENGVGGQMTSGRVLEMAYDPDQATLKQLDQAGINAITMDPTYGVMIMSEKTSVKSLSDYSYGSYSGALDYIVRNIVEQALPPQIEKFNDDGHRATVKRNCENIIQPMTLRPNNCIFQFAVKCDDQNNDSVVLDNEQFVVQVAIKLTRKARTIILSVINTPQGIDITTVFA